MEDVKKQETNSDSDSTTTTETETEDVDELTVLDGGSTSKVTPRTRVVRKEIIASALGDNSAYLIVCGVIIVALVMIVGVLCLCSRCKTQKIDIHIAD